MFKEYKNSLFTCWLSVGIYLKLWPLLNNRNDSGNYLIGHLFSKYLQFVTNLHWVSPSQHSESFIARISYLPALAHPFAIQDVGVSDEYRRSRQQTREGRGSPSGSSGWCDVGPPGLGDQIVYKDEIMQQMYLQDEKFLFSFKKQSWTKSLLSLWFKEFSPGVLYL